MGKITKSSVPLALMIIISCFRETLSFGSDACLQIYSVPKQTIICEPSEEVRGELDGIQTAIASQVDSIQALNSRVDQLDPDKPKELPKDVRVKLEEIDGINMIQKNQSTLLHDVKTQVATLLAQMATLEFQNRAEFTRMIEMQTELVTAMWHQSNLTLHEEYMQKVNDSVTHFMIQLQTLEISLRDMMVLKEAQMVNQLSENTRLNNIELEKNKLEFQVQLNKLIGDLTNEQQERLDHFNITMDHHDSLENLQLHLDNLRLKQDLLEVGMEKVEKQQSLQGSDITDGMAMNTKLEGQLLALQAKYSVLNDELSLCKSHSSLLTSEVEKMKEIVNRWQHLTPRALRVHDCQDALTYYYPVSGVFSINPGPALQPYEVYCQMKDNQVWTVIQRRMDGSVDFFRGWSEYEAGFGDANGEYWLGLQRIHILTNSSTYRLHVDIQDWRGRWRYAEYESFRIDDDANNYTLHVSGYHGDAGDSLSYHDNMPFTTMDRNNDRKDGLCATWCHGAWWYKDCFLSNLNGRYYNQGPYVPDTNWGDGVNWKTTFNTYYYSFKTVAMKVQRVS